MLESIPHIEGLATNGWMGVVVMFILFGYLYAIGVSGRQYVKKLSALGTQRRRIVNYTDEINDWRANMILRISVVTSVGMFAFVIMVKAGFMSFGLLSFALFVAGAALVYLLRRLTVRAIGSIFHFDTYVSEIKMNVVYVTFGFLSMLFSMVAVEIESSEVLYILALLLLICGIVAESIILVENFFMEIGSLFYIFLYLCAAEILPLMVGFRALTLVFN